MPRILIIESDATHVETAQQLLERAGHRVLVASDVRAGITLARRERLHLIICNLQAPDSSGVLEQLKLDAACARTPIVALTSGSSPGGGSSAQFAGFDGYFASPIEPASFVAQIEAFLPARP